MNTLSYLKVSNVDYLELAYQDYLKNPDTVEESLRYFFDGMSLANEGSATNTTSTSASGNVVDGASLETEYRAYQITEAFRRLGHRHAKTNPLPIFPSSEPNLKHWGIEISDLSKPTQFGAKLTGQPATLQTLIQFLQKKYCGSVGAEIGHIQNPEIRQWACQQIESGKLDQGLDTETKLFIYNRVLHSESFERFLHARYVGQKRFSVEGGEAIIPALDAVFEAGGALGVKGFVVGMAHRGRLNVLTHTFGKKYEMMFTEFEGNYLVDESKGEGDVKYHKGYSKDFVTRKGHSMHLTLAANPSHLEFVNAVVSGMVKAKQDLSQDADGSQTVGIQIHGDAAFAGQGVCYEVLNLSGLAGYRTGGSVHFIINNQVGFTTPVRDARSTPYSSDLALMLDVPIFHVNGSDVEAVWKVSQLAFEFRQKFKRDVFIDILCYRKHGHNEGDEPTFTQPVMYQAIKAQPSPREAYQKRLLQEQVLNDAKVQLLNDTVQTELDSAQQKAKAENPTPVTSVFEGAWKGFHQPTEIELFTPVQTAVPEATLKGLASMLNHLPPTFHLHPKLTRFVEGRQKAISEGKGLDWGNAETLAYATLLQEGYNVRLSGQDAERGTFSHRHSVFYDHENNERYCPLETISKASGSLFRVHNSHLSETGVMGFEYGYSLSNPKSLTIWEAQFGDFANGAQVIIDQFLATSESKWQRMTGLTLLLPHGYEGQGPEHSSARLERFLQLSGKNNYFVCNLSTPAQIFHALRRQQHWKFRKPLVIMSPKSLLRHPLAVSNLSDLSNGSFQEVIGDRYAPEPSVKRVVLCTGKVYYELFNKREELKRMDVALVRLEQIHPFPEDRLAAELKRYPGAEIVWVQEEPRNMGAWGFVFQVWSGGLATFCEKVQGRQLRYIGRAIGCAPAVGSAKVHEKEQRRLIDEAFA